MTERDQLHMHAAWQDGKSAECGISFVGRPQVTFIHSDVTCPICRERVARRIAGLSGVSVDDVVNATWGKR